MRHSLPLERDGGQVGSRPHDRSVLWTPARVHGFDHVHCAGYKSRRLTRIKLVVYFHHTLRFRAFIHGSRSLKLGNDNQFRLTKLINYVTIMSTTEKVLLLNSKNYAAWKQIISAHLDYKGCLEMLTRAPANPEEVKKEKQALFILKSSIDPSELIKTGDCLTALELWNKLKDNFEGTQSTKTVTVSAEWA